MTRHAMIRHSRRVILATLVALIGLGSCVVTAISCIQVLIGTSPLLPFTAMARLGASLSVGGPIVIGAEAVVLLIGLVLLGAALLPGRPQVLPLRVEPLTGPEVRAGTTRASLTATLAASAADVDGVDKARVRLRRRRVRVRARTPLHQRGDLAEHVRNAVSERLDEIALAQRPRITIRVRTRKE